MVERIEIRGAGVTLAGDVHGPRDGQPVIFLHGGGQTRSSWGAALEVAGSRGYRAYSFDLRGHGESGWSPDGDYHIDRYADDLRCVIKALDQAPVLIGASLGGMIALPVAAAPPPEIRALVLVDVTLQTEVKGAQEITSFMRGSPNGFASVDEAADAVAAYLPNRKRPKDTSGLMKNLRLRNGRYHWHWDPAFLDRKFDTPMFDLTVLEECARALTVPTLLIRGARSRVLDEEAVAHFFSLAPATDFAEVPGADHMAVGDANDSFNAVVFDYLERLKPATA